MKTIGEDEIALLHRYICEGIGDPKRLHLLYLVHERPYNVSELTEALAVSQPTVSHHLRILRERGLVTVERQGNSVYYSLADHRIIEAINMMRHFLADLLLQNAKTLSQD